MIEHKTATERRRYFRMDDEAIIDIKPMSEDVFQFWKEKRQYLQNEIPDIDAKIGVALHKVRSHNPEVADVLELFQQKINTIQQQHVSVPKLNPQNEPDLQQINLSACGMGIHTKERYQTGGYVQINLTLLPSNTLLELVGKIINIENTKNEHAPHFVRIDFLEMEEAKRELLVQHLFQLQSRRIRVLNEQELDNA